MLNPFLVKDINPNDSSTPSSLTVVGNTLFFTANDGSNGTELWKSDGTPEGTVLVKDIRSGGNSTPSSLTVVGNTLFFRANDGVNGIELWKSDGTANGTVLVKNINPEGNSYPGNFTVVGDTLFFTANDGVNGYELWKSDGTANGTVLVKDIRSGTNRTDFSDLTAMGNTLFFRADDGIHGSELWKSDGTANGTVLVKNINPGSSGSFQFGSFPSELTVVGDTLFFAANDGVNGRELWKSDGTANGTVLVKDINPEGDSDLDKLTAVGDTLFFLADDGVNGLELWKSNGTADGTVLVKNINSGSVDFPFGFIPHLTAVGNILFFTANDGVNGLELWKSDGTPDGTVLVKDINSNSDDSSYPSWLTVVGNTLFFSAIGGSNGKELWKSDGTANSTVLVKDIVSGASGSYPGNLTVVGDTLFFSANDGSNENELWALNLNAPVITSGNTADFAENNTGIVYTATAINLLSNTNPLTYSISGGVDSSLFQIHSTTGALSFLSAPNFEAPADDGANNVYDVQVQVTNGVNPVIQNIQITVTDINEAPSVALSSQTNSLAENTDTTTRIKVADIAITDDALGTYSLSLSGTDAGVFEIVGTELFIKAGTVLDYETQSSYSVTIEVDDTNLGTGVEDSVVFNLTLSDVIENLPPTALSLSNTSLNENVSAGTEVGTFSTTDPDAGDTFTYTLVNGIGDTDNAAFTLIGNQLKINTSPDFEEQSTYSVRVRTTDQGGLSFEEVLAINVNNLNETPSITSGNAVNFAENSTGTVYTVTAIDPENDPITYSISGSDAGLFSINNITGAIAFKNSPDFEMPQDNGGDNIYNITVTANDGHLDSTPQAIIITVTDLPDLTNNNDTYYGGGADNLIYSLDGDDILHGQGGNDTIYGGVGNDRLYGDAGNDILNGDEGDDWLYGGNNNDLLNGGLGNDRLHGDAGNDILNGDDGDDWLYGGSNNDLLNGGVGNDRLYGDAGDDILNGDDGDDWLYGGNNNDLLNGGVGNDRLYGDAGNDTLNGGVGSDSLTGGAGVDIFRFQFGESSLANPDQITDFAFGTDKIDVLTGTPGHFSRASDSNAATLASVVNHVFLDANGAIAGAQALAINSAALVRVTTASIAGTYLIVNNGTASFNSTDDLVINLKGYTGTLPALGDITPINSVFV